MEQREQQQAQVREREEQEERKRRDSQNSPSSPKKPAPKPLTIPPHLVRKISDDPDLRVRALPLPVLRAQSKQTQGSAGGFAECANTWAWDANGSTESVRHA